MPRQTDELNLQPSFIAPAGRKKVLKIRGYQEIAKPRGEDSLSQILIILFNPEKHVYLINIPDII
jgi:hypothetical protein